MGRWPILTLCRVTQAFPASRERLTPLHDRIEHESIKAKPIAALSRLLH
jgi:hypothetical protein